MIQAGVGQFSSLTRDLEFTIWKKQRDVRSTSLQVEVTTSALCIGILLGAEEVSHLSVDSGPYHMP